MHLAAWTLNVRKIKKKTFRGDEKIAADPKSLSGKQRINKWIKRIFFFYFFLNWVILPKSRSIYIHTPPPPVEVTTSMNGYSVVLDRTHVIFISKTLLVRKRIKKQGIGKRTHIFFLKNASNHVPSPIEKHQLQPFWASWQHSKTHCAKTKKKKEDNNFCLKK